MNIINFLLLYLQSLITYCIHLPSARAGLVTATRLRLGRTDSIFFFGIERHFVL
jgi:hypothetical protein